MRWTKAYLCGFAIIFILQDTDCSPELHYCKYSTRLRFLSAFAVRDVLFCDKFFDTSSTLLRAFCGRPAIPYPV
jgi:hypothetical protein